MYEPKTIDEFLQVLTTLKAEHGGECCVRLVAPYNHTIAVTVGVGATAKNDVRRSVSRGGNPCVLLSS